MTLSEHLCSSLKGNFQMLTATLADFSDADLLTRPVPNANHPNWQLGHLIKSETGLLSACGAKMPTLPTDFEPRYTKETASSDDAGKFLTKKELLTLYETVRFASIAFAQSLTPEQLAAPGPEKYRAWVPTVADAIAMMAGHLTMHLGQIQVLRRKLNKPILF